MRCARSLNSGLYFLAMASILLDQTSRNETQGGTTPKSLFPGPVGTCGDLAALLAQNPADRLDRMPLAGLGVEERQHQRLRGRVSPAKKVVAAFDIAISSRSRVFSAFNLLISSSSAVVFPALRPASTSAQVPTGAQTHH